MRLTHFDHSGFEFGDRARCAMSGPSANTASPCSKRLSHL
jgi:hypothetical protein